MNHFLTSGISPATKSDVVIKKRHSISGRHLWRVSRLAVLDMAPEEMTRNAKVLKSAVSKTKAKQMLCNESP